MTRVSSYRMYQCPSCRQVHISPIYASVSVYVPKDLDLRKSTLKSCAGCRNRFPLDSFLYLGVMPRPIKDMSWLLKDGFPNSFWEKIARIFNLQSKQKIQPEPSDIYPYLND